VLLVLDRSEDAVWRSFRNLKHQVQIVLPEELNAHDIVVNDWLVFSRATLDTAVARLAPAAPEPESEPA
jgi:large subunit ribosomal protein L4